MWKNSRDRRPQPLLQNFDVSLLVENCLTGAKKSFSGEFGEVCTQILLMPVHPASCWAVVKTVCQTPMASRSECQAAEQEGSRSSPQPQACGSSERSSKQQPSGSVNDESPAMAVAKCSGSSSSSGVKRKSRSGSPQTFREKKRPKLGRTEDSAPEKVVVLQAVSRAIGTVSDENGRSVDDWPSEAWSSARTGIELWRCG